MIFISIAWNIDIPDLDARIAAKDQDRLGFIGVLSQILHHIIGLHWHLSHVLFRKTIGTANKIYHSVHVRLLNSIVNHTEGKTTISKTFWDRI